MSLLLAQSGHSRTEFKCPLLGVKRISRGCTRMSAFDPKRTLTSIPLRIAVHPHRPCRKLVKDSIFKRIQSQQPRWEEVCALQAQKHWRATHSSWWLARSYADRSGGGNCGLCKNRCRTPEGDLLAREFGDNNAAGTLSRKRRKSEQGKRCHPLPTETVGFAMRRKRSLRPRVTLWIDVRRGF